MGKQIVVGGGIAGISTALFLAERGHKVILVEAADKIGGLLNSIYPFNDEFSFDFGPHFPRETGIPEIDKILYASEDLSKYSYLKVGSYNKGLYEKSGFPFDFHLENRSEYFSDMNPNRPISKKNLLVQLYDTFGEGYSKNLIIPILEKFFKEDISCLKSDSHKLFSLDRIITLTERETIDRKTNNDYYDKNLAFHSYEYGLSTKKSLYPKFGGIGSWIDELKKKLINNGVEIKTNSYIDKINTERNKVKSIIFGNTEYQLENIFWTVPLIHLNKHISVEFSNKIERLNSLLIHYTIDSDYLTGLFYIQCNDSNLKSFRITLYDNFSSMCHKSFKRITVEILYKNDEIVEENIEDLIFDELKTIGVISLDTNFVNHKAHMLKNTFPIPKNQDEASTNFNSSFSNIHFFGKSYSEKWFMEEIITEIYESINEKINF